jgi:hypothetical protein
MRWMIVGLLACGVMSDARAEKQVDPRLKEFARQKRQQTEELAAKLHLDVPPEAREFFKAAEAGDWTAVSNVFERIRPSPAGTNASVTSPGLNNVLFIPIHETFWTYDEFNRWDGTMMQKFADGILRSIPAGSIYFGGTDPGRFVITAVRDAAKSPDIFVLTQNGLGITSHYTEYLRLMYGGHIWIPSEKDVQQASQQVGEEANNLNYWMSIVGTLTKSIFDNNKDKHEFYVEESYVIPWMYPYLEPHGLIMKLNAQPLPQLDPAIVAKDRQFWSALTKELLADKRFLGNEWGRNTFAKLRSSIGGLYQYRHQTNEAEVVFKQSLELGPTTPEPAFRLAQLYTEAERFDDGAAVLEQLQARMSSNNPYRPLVSKGIAQILEMKQQAAEKQAK